MSFRNRPVLDRRHRPRWQDELRTQQLVIAGFALAIALAIGIFGATSWNAYWEAHLRPVADVSGTAFVRSELTAREEVMSAELTAQALDLQGQLGGPRDAFVEQQIQALSLQLSSLSGAANDSLVQGAVLGSRAEEHDIVVTDAEVDAEIAQRRLLDERVRLQLILVEPGAAADGEEEPPAVEEDEPDDPTEEEVAAAREEADAARQRIDDGEEFGAVATEVSDDFTAQAGGDLGWVLADDLIYDEYFELAGDADVDEVVGPTETEEGFVLLKVLERREPSEDAILAGLLERSSSADAYRSFVRDELLVEAFRTHFSDQVAVSPQPQRRVAQLFIAPPQGEPIPQQRARHILIQPLPGEEDQAAATDEQWAAALEEAEAVREELSADGADWFALAEEHSGDPGSQNTGGDLGWFDPATSGFVEPFVAALAELEIGELTEPVRTDFGYHLIQLLAERTSPQAQAEELVEELRADPESFGEVATRLSEDHETAREEGELGWIAPYELPAEREEVLFALEEVGAISDPVDLGDEGIYIFRLLETSESREIEDERLEQIRGSGFEAWLETEVESGVPVWIDPEFASAPEA